MTSGAGQRPKMHEISAAILLSHYFGTKVHIVEKSTHKTADFKIGNQLWEVKSPTGAGKNTIQRNVKKAFKQSENIIIDCRRTQIPVAKIKNELRRQVHLSSRIKRLLIIEKSEKIIVIK